MKSSQIKSNEINPANDIFSLPHFAFSVRNQSGPIGTNWGWLQTQKRTASIPNEWETNEFAWSLHFGFASLHFSLSSLLSVFIQLTQESLE